MNCSRILVVRLPCKKIYPVGPVYLLSLLKRAAPIFPFVSWTWPLSTEPYAQRSAAEGLIRAFSPT